MAYVRVRGRQLALVRSLRDPKTRDVVQEVLFVLYTRAEARAALGRGTPGGAEHFRSLLKNAYPDHHFNWSAIRRGIEAHLEVLPETAPEADVALEHSRRMVHDFLREMAQLDPRSAARGQRTTLETLSAELRFAHELLGTHLAAIQEPAPVRPAVLDQHPPVWRFGTRRDGPTPDVAQTAKALYERGELDAAEERFRLLTEVFPHYAGGLNMLGVIALDQGDLPRARKCFEMTVEAARKHFPARIARSSWWSLLETRPYIRGLYNLATTLIRQGRYPEAFVVADRLERECAQEDRAILLRARIHVNSQRFLDAATESSKLVGLWPSEAFLAGLAFAELGLRESATVHLLHALLNHPTAGRLITAGRGPRPRSWTEGRDWEVVLELRDNLPVYFAKRARVGLAALRVLLREPRVRSLIEKVQRLERERHQGKAFERARFDELQKLKSLDFARETAEALIGHENRRA